MSSTTDRPYLETGTRPEAHLAAAAWQRAAQLDLLDHAEVVEERLAVPLMDHLRERFQLTGFETDCVLLGTLPFFHGHGLTVGNLLSGHPDFTWSALGPRAPLRQWMLLAESPSPESDPLDAPIRICENLFQRLIASPFSGDPRLEPFLSSSSLTAPLHERQIALLRPLKKEDPESILAFQGQPLPVLESAAAVAADLRGWSLSVVPVEGLPADAPARDVWIRLATREALLEGHVLLFTTPDSNQSSKAEAYLKGLGTPAWWATPALPVELNLPCRRITLPTSNVKERHELIDHTTQSIGIDLNGHADGLAESFDLFDPQIYFPLRDALEANAPLNSGELNAVCRQSRAHSLNEVAEHVILRARLEDLVLPDALHQQLQALLLHARERYTVLHRWGFARRTSRGLGLSALFHGPSGTGKTMSAEVLARELELDLYRVDLSQLVSKYIGETEKNIDRVFRAATGSGVVLVFEEADALFSKRTEVKSAHDRYANLETAFLLQRMEQFDGLAILTSNLPGNLDTAFLRRLRFVLPFAFPSRSERQQIWERAFPPETPTESIDFASLAALPLTGGNIHNIALHAAYRAAGEKRAVNGPIILQAAREEALRNHLPVQAFDKEIARDV